MKILNLEELLKEEGKTFVSIYMSTHRIASEAIQDPIRFKNLLNKAKKEIDESSISVSKEEFFKEADELLENQEFWKNGLGSLLVVISEDDTYVLDRDSIFEENREVLFIADKPYLIPLFDKNYIVEDYYILDIANDRFKAYTYDDEGLSEIELPHIKQKFDELFDDKDVSDADYHGHNAAGDVRELENEKYIRYIASEMGKYFKTVEKRRILLFGTTESVAIFNEFAKSYDIDIYYTFEKPFAAIRSEDFDKEIFEDLRNIYVKNLREKIENLNTMLSNGLASSDLLEIKRAAEFSAIDTLYIDRDYKDIATKSINDLVIDTLKKDGKILLFDKNYNVWPAELIAEFRFNPFVNKNGANE